MKDGGGQSQSVVFNSSSRPIVLTRESSLFPGFFPFSVDLLTLCADSSRRGTTEIVFAIQKHRETSQTLNDWLGGRVVDGDGPLVFMFPHTKVSGRQKR